MHAPAPGSEAVGAVTLAPHTVVTGREALGVDELFLRGQQAASAGRWGDAARDFDRIVEHDPHGPWASRALLEGGVAREDAGQLAQAATRFEQLTRRFASSPLGSEALLRSLRIWLHLGRYRLAASAAERLVAREPELRPTLTSLALAGLALGSLEMGDSEGAARFLARGLRLVDRHRLDRAGRLPRDLAAFYYAMGESKRAAAARVELPRGARGFAAALERRCVLLLQAQDAYSATMRAYDAHWSAAAGYRVGQLYEDLHREVLLTPPPGTAGSEQQRLFRGAMQLRYSVLLDKALLMTRHTLAMLERSESSSRWLGAVVEAEQRLQSARQAQDAALESLPYTQAQLRAALERLRDDS